jgi:hypothetical protein
MMTAQSYLAAAREVHRLVTRILTERPGTDPGVIKGWELSEHGPYIWLFAILDELRIPSLETYTSQAAIHHLSTALKGKPVLVSNHTGIRYAILLSKKPKLPKRVPFPGLERGYLRIGIRHTGNEIHTTWHKLGHILVAGKTGSGKSVFIRLLAYQAIAEEYQLLIVDPHGTTFPMLVGHRSLLEPLQKDGKGALQILERGLGECRNREGLFQQVPGFPEDLDEYNSLATKQGFAPLPRLIIILDEFNLLVDEETQVAELSKMLGREGRKFGVQVIFCVQGLTLTEVGRIRQQVGTVVAFRTDTEASVLKKLGIGPASKLPAHHPGLAFTNHWGPVQTYLLDKADLVKQISPQISNFEVQIIQQSLAQNDGKFSGSFLQSWGMGEWQSRQLVKDWEQRGWLKKDPKRSNARYITLKLAEIVSNLQTPQTASIALKPSQTQILERIST